MDRSLNNSEPPPGLGHFSAVVNGKVWMWGGHTSSPTEILSPIANTVHIFDPEEEKWQSLMTDGKQPSTLYYGTCTSVGGSMYIYGGQEEFSNSDIFTNSLYKLDLDATKTPNQTTWTHIDQDGPMKSAGCGMVSYENKLVLFGGYGNSPNSSNSSDQYLKSYKSRDGCTWANHLHIFDLEKGEGEGICYWICPHLYSLTGPS